MDWMLYAGIILAAALVTPWVVWPISRAVPLQGIGWRYERLWFGLWVPGRLMSSRRNRLEHELAAAKAKVKRLAKQLEDEERRLEKETTVINERYGTFLMDHAGKRHWTHLYLMVPVPSKSFLTPLQKLNKKAKSGRESTYTLDEVRDKVAEIYEGMPSKLWGYRDPRNKQQDNNGNQNNQRKKGNNQQNNGNNNNNQ